VNPLPMEAVPANPLPMVARSIAIVNPAETGVTLQFLVDGQLKSLPSGSRLELTAVQAGVLDYDRGGSFGKTRLVMADGIYTFAGTERGWTLNQTPYTPPETDQVAAE